jgi:hypothetical protein
MALVPDLVPEIFRQRHLIEGRFSVALDSDSVGEYLTCLVSRVRSA